MDSFPSTYHQKCGHMFFGNTVYIFITYRAYVSGVLCGHYNAHMLKCFRLADVKLAVYG